MALDAESGPATCARGLEMLERFRPAMGARYARGRNYDRGPGQHRGVSRLSPYIRRRLVTEREAVAAALAEHGPDGARKFVEEVVWRGYFKGWLERRPGVWRAYREGLTADLAMLDCDPDLARRLGAAERGATGLDFMDAWARELTTTGYLHNHARMWFASAWIFTLELPWRLGADFFYRHLLDGDPASNTLGWRWVAGLHTRGRTYQAQAWNIAKFTGGRFHPADADLAADTPSLDATEPEGLPPPAPVRTPLAPDQDRPTLLLVTEEDCQPEAFDHGGLDIRGACLLRASRLRSPLPVADHVAAFEAGALRDAAGRIGYPARTMEARDPGALVRWASDLGAGQIVTAYIPEGPLGDWIAAAIPALHDRGVRLAEWRRSWDDRIWPHATAGFFKVKSKIPRILEGEGLL